MAGPRDPLRIGMIGAGFIAQVAHLHAFSRILDARIVALAETHDGLREAVARRFGIETTTADYRDILSGNEIDAVVVCVPRNAQSRVVADALAAKQRVLSEKPMAMTLEEAAGNVAVARSAGALWMVGYMKRHDLGVQRFARLLASVRDDGTFGAILDVGMRDFCGAYGVAVPDHIRRIGPRPLRYPEALPVPAFVTEALRPDYDYTLNVASHDINLLRMLFGDRLTVTGFSIRPGGAQHALLDAGTFPISLVVGPADIGRWDQQIDVTFERGRVSLILPSPLARHESASIRLERTGHTEQIAISAKDHVWAFERQAAAFIESVRTGIEADTSGAASLADIALIDSLWRSRK